MAQNASPVGVWNELPIGQSQLHELAAGGGGGGNDWRPSFNSCQRGADGRFAYLAAIRLITVITSLRRKGN